MSKRLAGGVLTIVVVLGVAALLYSRLSRQDAATGDPETRIIEYLKEHVRPGQPVYVTELYNTVFTTSGEREVIERLHNTFFKIPASAAQIYKATGRMPTLQELSNQFQFKVPGEMDVLLRVMESDPRVPKFFERDRATGEFLTIDVDRIAADEQFGQQSCGVSESVSTTQAIDLVQQEFVVIS